jgi:hypothetical protein
MDFKTRYPEYASVEEQIREARLTRAVMVSHAIAEFIVDCWNAVRQPPEAAPVLIDRRRESRSNVTRLTTRLTHR